VVIALHGGSGNKNTANNPIRAAAKFAQHGLATIAINAVGHGGGPLGTLTVTKANASTVTLPAGGRTVDQNGDGDIRGTGEIGEGLTTAPGGAQAIVFARDGIRQTDADLMQLVREIEVGMDVDDDSVPDLDPSHVYYFGNSAAGFYGTPLVALAPDVRAGVLGGTGGSLIDFARLSIAGRGLVSQILCPPRNPRLDNGGPDPVLPMNPCPFRENLPLRNQPPVVNNVTRAIPIQEEIERIEWAGQAGDLVAYAPHLRKDRLPGVPAKPVLFPFAQGDRAAPNTVTAALLRAGDLADRTMYFRGSEAYAANDRMPTANDLHEFLFRLNTADPFRRDMALAGQESVATFLASDGLVTVNPDSGVWGGPWFETPIQGPLPGELP
jgi:hypothetical protein